MAPESSCCPLDGPMVRREPPSRPSQGEWATPSLSVMSLVVVRTRQKLMPRSRGSRPLRLRDGHHGPSGFTPSRRRRRTRRSGGNKKNCVDRRGSCRFSKRRRHSSSSRRRSSSSISRRSGGSSSSRRRSSSRRSHSRRRRSVRSKSGGRKCISKSNWSSVSSKSYRSFSSSSSRGCSSSNHKVCTSHGRHCCKGPRPGKGSCRFMVSRLPCGSILGGLLPSRPSHDGRTVSWR